ncbi:hypothetical protein VT84_00345 [Gemmata sp. SH-PL17]|uniref:hypothetical protein n=1 Tax=Gemmata sp. SH-PL17 TaxID=1630693 RepID=UPI00078E5B09|nr:hypothetical protein [Gemmata sp. SH-PL17]AMV22827.1 hypothetical protein VT84_00345 [Gemmata sp. SH-PL17]
MTFTPADLDLSPEAAARFDSYLSQVRAALAGTGDVNPGEIEADIREHVENELHAAPRPVPLAALDAVLTKLGPPSQWGTTNDPTLLHRARHLFRERLLAARAGTVERAKRVRFTLWNGPEDWRLAYLAFGVFALGALTMIVFPIALVVSYILARAGLAVAAEKGIALGAGRKWLLYPPVVLVNLVLLIALVVWPVAAAGITGREVAASAHRIENFDRPDPVPRNAREMRDAQSRQEWKDRVASQVEEDRKLLAMIPANPRWAPLVAALFVGFGAFALWWAVLGSVTATFPLSTRAVFHPLCNSFEPRHGRWVAVACVVLLIPWGAAVYDIIAALV